MKSLQVGLLAAMLAVIVGSPRFVFGASVGGERREANFRGEFFTLCDHACRVIPASRKKAVEPGSYKIRHYRESYVIRALAVAYDLTHNKKYLDVCKTWSDEMADYQNRMTPAGAYYMAYGRKPGQNKGDWYVADSSSIAMGVLATAARCTASAEKARYLKSVESFAQLVIDRYIGPGGGVTDGLWSQFDGEWWCSTGIFGSLAFLLHNETGKEKYKRVALGAVDWINRLDYTKVKHPYSFEEGAPTVVMYILETYSAGMPHLEAASQRRKLALAQIGRTLQWMEQNQRGRGKGSWDYNVHRGTKHGSLPFHMYVYSRTVPEIGDITAEADRELRYISRLLFAEGKPKLTELAVFAIMSYAERVGPGSTYRSSKSR